MTLRHAQRISNLAEVRLGDATAGVVVDAVAGGMAGGEKGLGVAAECVAHKRQGANIK